MFAAIGLYRRNGLRQLPGCTENDQNAGEAFFGAVADSKTLLAALA